MTNCQRRTPAPGALATLSARVPQNGPAIAGWGRESPIAILAWILRKRVDVMLERIPQPVRILAILAILAFGCAMLANFGFAKLLRVDPARLAAIKSGIGRINPDSVNWHGQGGVVGRLQTQTQEREDGGEQSLRLPPGQPEQQPQGQRGFDGHVRVPPLPATETVPVRLPRGDHLRSEPDHHVAPPHQSPVVLCPVRDAVSALVAGMDLRPALRHGTLRSVRAGERRMLGRRCPIACRSLHQRPEQTE